MSPLQIWEDSACDKVTQGKAITHPGDFSQNKQQQQLRSLDQTSSF